MRNRLSCCLAFCQQAPETIFDLLLSLWIVCPESRLSGGLIFQDQLSLERALWSSFQVIKISFTAGLEVNSLEFWRTSNYEPRGELTSSIHKPMLTLYKLSSMHHYSYRGLNIFFKILLEEKGDLMTRNNLNNLSVGPLNSFAWRNQLLWILFKHKLLLEDFGIVFRWLCSLAFFKWSLKIY